MSRLFKVNNNISIVCDCVSTRYGFRHDAKLFVNGYATEKAKCCYYNRTWERFEFETVISKLLDKTDRLTARQKAKFKTTLSKYQ